MVRNIHRVYFDVYKLEATGVGVDKERKLRPADTRESSDKELPFHYPLFLS